MVQLTDMKSFEEWLADQQFFPSNPAELDVLKRVYDEMCANAEASKTEIIKGRLCDWATQYYVAGRMAACARLVPVYGNLLHHAVEMYLKTALVGVVSLKDLKNKYIHDLEKLWQRFKAKEADTVLDRFDATIHALHEFEDDLRYPDKIPHAAILMAITWEPSRAVEQYAGRPTPTYEVFISDVDRLVIEILKRVPLNPKFFSDRVGPSGREALQYQNPHAADWLC